MNCRQQRLSGPFERSDVRMLTDAWEHKRTAETGSVDPWWRSPLASGVLSLPARPGVLLLSCRFPRWETSLATIAAPWYLGIRDRTVAHASYSTDNPLASRSHRPCDLRQAKQRICASPPPWQPICARSPRLGERHARIAYSPGKHPVPVHLVRMVALGAFEGICSHAGHSLVALSMYR